MTKNELTNNQVNFIMALTGINHSIDLAIRKFEKTCMEYKLDPLTTIYSIIKENDTQNEVIQ